MCWNCSDVAIPQSYAQEYLSLIVGCTGQHFQHLCEKLVHDTTGLVARGQ